MPNKAGGYFFEELTLGQKAQSKRTVTQHDIALFGEASGDMNPVHFDEAFAATSRFGQRIAHGMLTASYISALIGMALPGKGSVYVSQSLTFKRPVKIGAEVTTDIEIVELEPKKGFVTLATTCTVDGRAVLTGTAIAMVDKQGGS